MITLLLALISYFTVITSMPPNSPVSSSATRIHVSPVPARASAAADPDPTKQIAAKHHIDPHSMNSTVFEGEKR